MTSSSSSSVPTAPAPAPAPVPAPLPPPSSLVTTITPATLASLAIYNPSLGPTDETVHDQIVFYTSRRGDAVTSNEKLRQIGLAQGIVEFARGFSKNENLSSIETQKSRIVTLEVEEPGWWILAQIDLTYIHHPSTPSTPTPTVEYSSREVSPPLVLLAQLRQAYNQFRFHYGSFAHNHAKLGRAAFCKRLDRYWQRWAWRRWEVLLHGSPATVVLGGNGGVKMAGGRPGKEMGDGERLFMKGWVEKEKGKARGMVEMLTFRFGDYTEELLNSDGDTTKRAEGGSGYWSWGNSARASIVAAMSTSAPQKKTPKGPGPIMPQDGCIFPGTGALESHSMRDIATYISELYQHGDEATKQRRHHNHHHRGKSKALLKSGNSSAGENSSVASSPRTSNLTIRPTREELGSKLKLQPAVVKADPTPPPLPDARGSLAEVAAGAGSSKSGRSSGTTANAKILNLLTFGWSGGGGAAVKNSQQTTERSNSTTPESGPEPEPEAEATPLLPPMVNVEPMVMAATEPVEDSFSSSFSPSKVAAHGGSRRARFVIGFLGDLYADDLDDDLDLGGSTSGRITSRTVWAERRRGSGGGGGGGISSTKKDSDGKGSSDGGALAGKQDSGSGRDLDLEEFRIVVYTDHPFIYAFIFDRSAPQLTSPAFYRTLHHQLSPLHAPLLKSSQLADTPGYGSLKPKPAHRPPYDLLYNPTAHTIHSTVPPIPVPLRPGSGSSPSPQSPHHAWTRADAFHVHTLILGILADTMRDRAECERSARSTKGWWINWMRLDGGEEGIVVRMAGEKKSDLLLVGVAGAAAGAGAGAVGVGVGGDVRKYFEGLVRGVR